jgi:hypothetical protein
MSPKSDFLVKPLRLARNIPGKSIYCWANLFSCVNGGNQVVRKRQVHSAWHSEKVFIGATRRVQAFVWDRERGLEAIINSNVVSM